MQHGEKRPCFSGVSCKRWRWLLCGFFIGMSSVAAVVTKGEQLLLADRVVRPAALVEAAEGNVKLVGMRIETFT